MAYLIVPSFQVVNRSFVFSFEGNPVRTAHTGHFLLKLKTKYNVIIIERIIDQSLKNDLRKYDNIQNITSFQGDDYTTRCLPNFSYFKEHYKMIAVDFNK